jgi:hypothetical protein
MFVLSVISSGIAAKKSARAGKRNSVPFVAFDRSSSAAGRGMKLAKRAVRGTNGEATGWGSREKPQRDGHAAETSGDTARKHARPTGSQRRSAPADHWEARCAEGQWSQNERDEDGRSEKDTGTNDDSIGR